MLLAAWRCHEARPHLCWREDALLRVNCFCGVPRSGGGPCDRTCCCALRSRAGHAGSFMRHCCRLCGPPLGSPSSPTHPGLCRARRLHAPGYESIHALRLERLPVRTFAGFPCSEPSASALGHRWHDYPSHPQEIAPQESLKVRRPTWSAQLASSARKRLEIDPTTATSLGSAG